MASTSPATKETEKSAFCLASPSKVDQFVNLHLPLRAGSGRPHCLEDLAYCPHPVVGNTKNFRCCPPDYFQITVQLYLHLRKRQRSGAEYHHPE